VKVLMNVARGIVRTERALREISNDALVLHVDAGDVYVADHPDLVAEAAHRQAVGFLALDLVSGRVDERHELYGWLLDRGVDEEELGWFRERPVVLEAVGINVYPLFSRKALERKGTRSRVVMRYGSPDLVEELCTMYHARYRCPVIVSETATAGSVARRMRWLEGSVASVRRARERGVPLVGYTWWPMLALIDWAYRRGGRAKHEYLKQMGLWDLAPRADGTLERVPTQLVSAFESITRTAGFDRNPVRPVLL
jgi:hypothetical protein